MCQETRRARVLIVDDNADCRTALRMLLEDWGHEVDEAADGEEAMSMTLTHRPDVIFLDVGLPGRSGYEVAKAVRAAQKDGTPSYIVAVTGTDRCDEAGAGACFDAFVTKPADPERFRALLAEHGARN